MNSLKRNVTKGQLPSILSPFSPFPNISPTSKAGVATAILKAKIPPPREHRSRPVHVFSVVTVDARDEKPVVVLEPKHQKRGHRMQGKKKSEI